MGTYTSFHTVPFTEIKLCNLITYISYQGAEKNLCVLLRRYMYSPPKLVFLQLKPLNLLVFLCPGNQKWLELPV